MYAPAKCLPFASRLPSICSLLLSHRKPLLVILHRSNSSSSDPKNDKNIVLPDPPDTCCMSNCANCVWIQYAQDLEKLFEDGGETAKRLIIERMDDPSMRAFLSLELTVAMRRKLDEDQNRGDKNKA